LGEKGPHWEAPWPQSIATLIHGDGETFPPSKRKNKRKPASTGRKRPGHGKKILQSTFPNPFGEKFAEEGGVNLAIRSVSNAKTVTARSKTLGKGDAGSVCKASVALAAFRSEERKGGGVSSGTIANKVSRRGVGQEESVRGGTRG